MSQSLNFFVADSVFEQNEKAHAFLVTRKVTPFLIGSNFLVVLRNLHMSLRHTLPPPVLFSAIDCKIGDVFLLTGANWVRVQLIECSYNDSIFLYLKQAVALEKALVCVEGIEGETPQHLCRHRVHSSLVLA